jgi:hypothetical protein
VFSRRNDLNITPQNAGADLTDIRSSSHLEPPQVKNSVLEKHISILYNKDARAQE